MTREAIPRGAEGAARSGARAARPLRVVLFGLSITSSWGNGHATNFRALMRALERRGHDALFLERDVPWYAAERDLPDPPWGRTELYDDLGDLRREHAAAVAEADLAIVGSYLPEGPAVARFVTGTAGGVTAFYDLDTPVTLAKLEEGDHEYLAPDLIPRFDLYLSFAGGPNLERLEREFGARDARAFYCFVDPERHRPVSEAAAAPRWDLGYLGTWSEDRQPGLERLLLDAARRDPDGRYAVAGPNYPPDVAWPPNVARREHLPPTEHARFYSAQRFTLNLTRAAMREAGWSPSVRLFEAAACGVPAISDRWDGLGELFELGSEIFTSASADATLALLHELPEAERRAAGARARERVLREHTAGARVEQLERLVAAHAPGTPPPTADRSG